MQRPALAILLLLACGAVRAQVTVGNADHVLEISGLLSTYYNQRIEKSGNEDHQKDRFNLRDAQLQFEGRYRNTFEYELQFDVADMSRGSGAIDPENPGLMDAYVKYTGISHLGIQFGYGKVPYGRSASVPFMYSPYWQRAELVRGDLFSIRDVGLTLNTSFWHDRATLYAGAYNGLGEMSLSGDNDASGHLEYVGRLEAAYPSRFRYREVDDRVSPVPMIAIGLSGRTVDKRQPTGEQLPDMSAGGYGIKVIDGVRTAAGIDVSAQWKGFSAQFEAHRIRLEPSDTSSALYHGFGASRADGHILAGGYVAQLTYFHRRSHLILSARYEELNLNDLADGVGRRAGGAIAYQIKGFDAMVKLQYWHIIDEETTVDPLDWTDQFRIGLQYVFN